MKSNRMGGFSNPGYAFIGSSNMPPMPGRLTAAGHRTELNHDNLTRHFHGGNSGRGGVLLRQYINSLGVVSDLSSSNPLQGSSLRFLGSGSGQLAISYSDGYRIQQNAYVAKIRRMLTPRLLSEVLKEIDSTKDNPPNSQSARFGIKPEPEVYKYRLVSWGEAGSGIPLINNPYSVRPQNAPAVDPGFKRKKFTTEQREAVRDAPYKKIVGDELQAGLHNSHGLASRFLGPETNANIAPATYTNHKCKKWGQGEMQSHLEHALFRAEAKARENGIQIFLRCTDYLGKFGELQSRKIKVFLSEPVVDKETLAVKGSVKETTLGTFYLPGLINESENGDLIEGFKKQVAQLEQAINMVVSGNPNDEASRPPFEMRYKYGICAQDLTPISQQKLMHGKINRSNDGLNSVLQRTPKRSIQNLNQETQSGASVHSSSQISREVLGRINEQKENPRVLKRGEEVWHMGDVETVLSHIRHPNLEDHIQSQIDSGQLSLEEAMSFHSLGLSRSSSESSISSQDTVSDEAKGTGRTVELEFEGVQDSPESAAAPTSDSSFVESASSSSGDHSLQGMVIAQPRTPPWLEKSSDKKRGAEL